MYVIIGLGSTGLSCARYLARKGLPFIVNDTRANPPLLTQFQKEFPTVPYVLGGLDPAVLTQASTLILSPGIASQEPLIVAQQERGIPVIGDIELFAKEAKAPIIAVTGTNAKSTVTTLIGEMAKTAQLSVGVGGNLGLPALDLLEIPAELFVLELSSFQLETTFSLQPTVATVLNITPDHLDRHGSMEAYIRAKQHIYTHCDVAVYNRDDPLTEPCFYTPKQTRSFTLNTPTDNEFGLIQKGNDTFLSFGEQTILPVQALPIRGRHYIANALAALAVGHSMGFEMDDMITTLMAFKGLPHRCQLVTEYEGVLWYNDSKGTNVGATVAAIMGVGSVIPGKLIVIAGGVGKNAEFEPLVSPLSAYTKMVILIGDAAPQIAAVIEGKAPYAFAESMEAAVKLAKMLANPGDGVLLSPACASFDMFQNYDHRGQVFTDCVLSLVK